MQKLVVANWKSNKNFETASAWLTEVLEKRDQYHPRLKIVLAVSYPLLWPLKEQIEAASANNFVLAVQDISPYPAGSYTGAVSTQNLAKMGVKYGLVGHSEQRKYFAETNAKVGLKVEQLVQAGIKPVVCLEGENIEAQAAAISHDILDKVTVAYDPMDAISTQGNSGSKPVSAVAEVFAQIKQVFGDVPTIYGGSVDENSVGQYLLEADGVLVGGASLDAGQFSKLLINAWVQNDF